MCPGVATLPSAAVPGGAFANVAGGAPRGLDRAREEDAKMLAWVLGAVVALAVLERLRPLRPLARPRAQRWPVNGVVGAGALLIARAVVVPVIERIVRSRVGLLARLDLPQALDLGLTFLAFDFSFYHWHRANHRVPLLWRLHRSHHTDPDLDVSTAVRFHPGEIAASTLFRAVQIAVVGPRLEHYVLYEAIFQCETYFHHSNLRLSARFERWLTWLVVTPRMHGIHHSQIKAESWSNFAVVLTAWDRLHRTLRLDAFEKEVAIGVPAHMRAESNRLGHVLGDPFKRPPGLEDWRAPDGILHLERAKDPSPRSEAGR